MGDFGYHLVVDPGERNPETVQHELRDEMPSVVSEAYEADIENDIWIENDTVHWSTGYPRQIYEISIIERVPDLDVDGRWAMMWYEAENEHSRGLLYARVDGDWALVEERHGRCRGRAVTTYMQTEWGIDCEVIRP